MQLPARSRARLQVPGGQKDPRPRWSWASVKCNGGEECVPSARYGVCVCVCVEEVCTVEGPLAPDVSWGCSPTQLRGPQSHTSPCLPAAPAHQLCKPWSHLQRRVPSLESARGKTPGGEAAGEQGEGLRRKVVPPELRQPYLGVIVTTLNLSTLTHGFQKSRDGFAGKSGF